MKRSIHWINQINSSGCEIQLWDKKYTIWFSNRDFKEAERDAEILINCLSNLAENEQLRAKLSQAQETIADFRSALEFYAKDFIDIDTEGNATRYKASAHNSDMAREVLARHPDSTEVNG